MLYDTPHDCYHAFDWHTNSQSGDLLIVYIPCKIPSEAFYDSLREFISMILCITALTELCICTEPVFAR